MEPVYSPVRKYINRRCGFSLSVPQSWARGIRESPGGDTTVLYDRDGELVRMLVSRNAQTRAYLEGAIADPFRTPLTTDGGNRGELLIGRSRPDPRRVTGWFYLTSGGRHYHLLADLSPSFAVENRDLLMELVRSVSLAAKSGSDRGRRSPDGVSANPRRR